MSHMLVLDPYAWALMRVASGLCVAGCYTVVEAWLNAKVTNETRGRTMGAYRVVDMSGSLAAQMIIGVLSPASYVSYNLLAILCCAALIPLTLTRLPQLMLQTNGAELFETLSNAAEDDGDDDSQFEDSDGPATLQGRRHRRRANAMAGRSARRRHRDHRHRHTDRDRVGMRMHKGVWLDPKGYAVAYLDLTC